MPALKISVTPPRVRIRILVKTPSAFPVVYTVEQSVRVRWPITVGAAQRSVMDERTGRVAYRQCHSIAL